MHIFGPSVDTTVKATDSTYNFTLTTQFQSAQNYKWNITTKDDFNETVAPDTFVFHMQQQNFASAISGIVFNDVNGNGIKDMSDNGIAQWKIKLSGVKTDSVITDENGTFRFLNLTGGNYIVTQNNSSAWMQTTLPATYSLTLSGTDSATNKNFGNFQFGVMQGTVFNDIDGDSTFDNSEIIITGWKIYIKKNNLVIDSSTSNVN